MGCELNQGTIAELTQTMFDNLDLSDNQKRIPIMGTIELTSRCNLRCVHCYIEGTPFKGELAFEEICGILDQLADAGCLWLLLTGGEPLVRPDFKDIYHYAKSKGFLITLFTNATLVTPELADFLAKEPPFKIEISVYGATGETYERVTGVPGSFQNCMTGIKLLKDRNLPISLKSMALTLNKHEIPDIKKFAESLGVFFRFDPMINATLDGSSSPFQVRLSPEEVVELDMADKDRVEDFRGFCREQWGAPVDDRLFGCGAGRTSFYISADGILKECLLGNNTNYDLRTGNFHDGFYNVIPEKVFELRWTRDSECRTCSMIGLCGICPAQAELACGDPEAKIDWLCQVAHLRVAALNEIDDEHRS